MWGGAIYRMIEAERLAALLSVGSDARRNQIRGAGGNVVDYIFPGYSTPCFGSLVNDFDQTGVQRVTSAVGDDVPKQWAIEEHQVSDSVKNLVPYKLVLKT